MNPDEIQNQKQTESKGKRYQLDQDSAAADAPMNNEHQLLQANQYFQSGNFAAAEKICRQVLSSNPDNAAAVHLLGVIAYQIGKTDKALILFQKALTIDPHNVVFHCSLGEVFKIQGRFNESIKCYQQAIALRPDLAEIHYDLGNTYHCQNAYTDAIRSFQRALKLKPDFVEAHYNLANTYMDRGDLMAAISHYQHALVLKPAYAEAYFNLGIACFELGKYDEAAAAYQNAVEVMPDMAGAYYNMGLTRYRQKKLNAAISCYQKAIELKGAFPEAYNNMGNAYQDQKQHPEAISCFRKALDLKPDYADAYYNLGKSLNEQSCYPDAIAAYQKALQVNPNHYKAANNMAKTYQDVREVQNAIYWFQKALHIKPDYAEAHFNLATAYLLTGEFQEGWKAYEWRFKRREWKRTYPYRYNKPLWSGEDFVGKRLFVHSEQGIGDILQFGRYLPWVKTRGGTVIFETRKALMGLFKIMSGIDELVMFSTDGNPTTEFDLYVPLANLPGIFNTTLENIPADVPYLFADREKSAVWKDRLKVTGLKIGLVWAGTDTDPRRACALEWLKPLSDITGVDLYGLQKGIAAEQIEVEGLPQGMRMTNLGQEFEDFTDTAAVIENLDMVISIDTSVAHLAGAMGKPVWLMLPYASDWRWLLNRDDSPWYPTMRLFRQPTPGNWEALGQQLANKLQQFAAKHKMHGNKIN